MLDTLMDEHHYLLWFWKHADFGPADSDVRAAMNAEYEAQGYVIPLAFVEEQ